MNFLGGGDAAPAVGDAKASSGRGRGRAKLNAPAPVATSSLTAPPQQQIPVAMVPEPRNRGPHWNALSQLDAGDYVRRHGEAHRDSQLQKCPPLSSSVSAEPPIRQQRPQAVDEMKGAAQRNPCSSQEEIDPTLTPSAKLRIIEKAVTDPDGLNTLQMQWLGFRICDRVTKDSNNVASAVEFCTSLIERGRTSAFIDGLVESCNDFFKRREQLLRRCTARTRSAAQHPGSPSRSWTAYVTFLAELLAAVSRMESSDKISGRIFCLAALLCECCHIMLRSPAQDTTAEMNCLRFVFMTAGSSIQRAAPHLSTALGKCLRDSFMDSNRSDDVRQALLGLIELRVSGWKLCTAQQL
ncbi:uncharacterized protein LOC119454524 [Dermacentor silvarum]|uniref:uncharacterized protein LOC119454524 n=1 Tax=Dermacentor silvarum TaxID=543639 RepID=UPI001897183F|nr:uncharacterized protein LOC119454524 [Dermacentor silvarum]